MSLGKIIELPRITDPRGNLTVAEANKNIPFDIKTFLLNHPYQGLLIDTKTWRTLDDFSSGAVCVVLASDFYDENDYIYDYNDFLQYINV